MNKPRIKKLRIFKVSNKNVPQVAGRKLHEKSTYQPGEPIRVNAYVVMDKNWRQIDILMLPDSYCTVITRLKMKIDG